MFKVIENARKESIVDMFGKYSGCVFTVKMDDIHDDEGIILAASDSPYSDI